MTEKEAICLLHKLKPTIPRADSKSTTHILETMALDLAINALEKQIAKKVKIEQWIYTKCDCGFEFSKHHRDGYYSIPIENKTKYCPNCGQKLDWSNED